MCMSVIPTGMTETETKHFRGSTSDRHVPRSGNSRTTLGMGLLELVGDGSGLFWRVCMCGHESRGRSDSLQKKLPRSVAPLLTTFGDHIDPL